MSDRDHKVKQVWVAVKVNDDGSEEFAAISIMEGLPPIPLTTTDERNLDKISALAKAVAERSGVRMEMRRFTYEKTTEVFGMAS